jgi:hypothetical protein
MSESGHFRGLARRPVSLAGVLSGPNGLWQRPTRLLDVGLGGARIAGELDTHVGAQVQLAVDSPHRWDPMELDARVVWTRSADGGTEVGLCFEHSTRATLRGLLELMVDELYD